MPFHYVHTSKYSHAHWIVKYFFLHDTFFMRCIASAVQMSYTSVMGDHRHFTTAALFDQPDDGIRIMAYTHRPNYSFWHDHDFYEIALIRCAGGRHKTAASQVPVMKGDLLFVNTGTVHRFAVKRPMPMLYILLSRSYMKHITAGLSGTSFFADAHIDDFIAGKNGGSLRVRLPTPAAHAVDGIAATMFKESRERHPCFVQMRDAYCSQLLAMCARWYGQSAPRARSTSGEPVTKALAYIRTRLARPLSLAAISKHVSCNPTYLSTAFRRKTGYSIFGYINEMRIRSACTRLAASNVQIIDAALSCGYENISLFNRMFKRYTGVTPTAYRMKARTNRPPVGQHDRRVHT